LTNSAITKANGGLSKIAKEVGINRVSLFQPLSHKGNPTFKTLIAVIHATGAKR
jgi:probable addiction module antidote protein